MLKEIKIANNQKKNHIKLIPSSLLPRINIRQIHSEEKDNKYIPSIKYKKIKTQSSRYNSSDKVSTKKSESNHDYKQQQSKSFRLISRFIYNHLRKKMNYQAQSFTPALGQQTQNNIRSYIKENRTSETEPIHFNSRSYKYTSPQLNNNNYFSYSRPNDHSQHNRSILQAKLKNKIIQTKYKKIQLSELKKMKNGQKGNSGSIDSYFDLSCLDQCN